MNFYDYVLKCLIQNYKHMVQPLIPCSFPASAPYGAPAVLKFFLVFIAITKIEPHQVTASSNHIIPT